MNNIQALYLPTADHTISTSRTASYTASSRDNNKTITCRITQADRNNIISMGMISLVLNIRKRREAVQLIKKAPLMSGLLLLIIILILSCIILTILVLKQKENKKRRKQIVSVESQSSPLVLKSMEIPKWRSEAYHKYLNNDTVFTEIADVTKPVSTTYREHCNGFSTFHDKSPYVNDLTSLYSHEDVTVIENPFNHPDNEFLPPSELPNCQTEPSTRSVPELYKRRSSIPARILINPTTFPPPQNAKSLGHLHTSPGQCQATLRRRRKTAPASSKSSQSVFDCDQGCFEVEDINRSQQMVFITTGPMVI